jgi:hypothetical protein
MKCLSLRQDWAAYVALGAKPVENRSWATKWRGPLLIHASVKPDPNMVLTTAQVEAAKAAIREKHQQTTDAQFDTAYAQGAIIAKVELIRIWDDFTDKPALHLWHEPGLLGWVFEDPVIFPKPIPYKGQLGVFEVPDSVIPEEWR